MASEQDFEQLLTLLNEKEVLLKERELSLNEQQEEFMAEKEELNAAIEEVVAKNGYLTKTLEQLKQRNNELDQILYRASHDLKTPVSSMMGLVGVMQSTRMDAEQQIIVDHLLEKAKQMESILTSLTRLSVAFFQQPTYERCAIENIVHDAWDQVKDKGGVPFEWKANNLQLMTDKTLLTNSLVCLLENAVTYSRPNHQNKISLEVNVSQSTVSVEIADCGEEIPADQTQKIFEIFHRGSVKSKGPGLGLYIARRIAERLNGCIRLENGKPRKKFILTLPEVTVS